MSDTEEIVIQRVPKAQKNTKPEIAREKLKEKRERLKKEKENMLIEEAKKRLADEQLQKQAEADQEQQKKMNDPTFLLMSKFDAMMEMLSFKNVKEPEPEKKTRKPRAKKEEVKEKPPPKPKASPKAPAPRKKKQVYYEAEESPSNIFIGRDVAPPQEPIQYVQRQQEPQVNPLLAHLSSRRNMNSVYY